MSVRSSFAGSKPLKATAARDHGQQADVRLNHRDHVVDSVHLHPTLAALERHGADDHAVGQLVNVFSSSITTGLTARSRKYS
jgi:hypothetical protein